VANSKIKLYEVNAGYIVLQPTGFVGIKPIKLHFTEDPSNIGFNIEGRGEYFVGSLISYNNYRTNYDNTSAKNINNFNIVESLTLLAQTPYEILPFLSPYMINTNMLDKLVYQFSIRKNVFKTILSRITKFSIPQDRVMIEAYESYIREQNKLLNIKEDNDSYYVEVVNPAVIPFLVKKTAMKDNIVVSSEAMRVLSESNLLEKIKSLERFLNEPQFKNIQAWALTGIIQVLSHRKTIFEKYIQIFKNNVPDQKTYKSSSGSPVANIFLSRRFIKY